MPVHRIHLRGPWNLRKLGDSCAVGITLPNSDVKVVKMPADWIESVGWVAGRWQFLRQFQWPTKLDPGERAQLVLTGVGGSGKVLLNEELLGEIPGTSATFDITHRLRSSNQLVIELEFDPNQSPEVRGGMWGVVALEVESPDQQPATESLTH